VAAALFGAAVPLSKAVLRKIGSARTSALFATSAVSGVAVAWLILGEQPQWRVFVGGAIMVIAVIVMASPQPTPQIDGKPLT
jgi:drug/metabolite transporter (DMT)-like permease